MPGRPMLGPDTEIVQQQQGEKRGEKDRMGKPAEAAASQQADPATKPREAVEVDQQAGFRQGGEAGQQQTEVASFQKVAAWRPPPYNQPASRAKATRSRSQPR